MAIVVLIAGVCKIVLRLVDLEIAKVTKEIKELDLKIEKQKTRGVTDEFIGFYIIFYGCC